MSSYNCCISQEPPSPDGQPSRLVKLSAQPTSAASCSTVSHLSKPEDVAELRALFERDDSDVDDDESRVITIKRSTSTLDAVRSKLRKHLSRESALSKHRLRSAVGNSDEEVQRRKELRLIRDRRIKEELSSEGAYDDDAKSLSTVAIESSPSRKQWLRIRSENMDSSEPLDVVASPLLLRWKSVAAFYVRNPSPVSALQRRHSITVLDGPRMLLRPTTDSTVRRSSSYLPMPPAPMLKPERAPTITYPTSRRTSWRQSFASHQRATKLRALSHEYELSISAAGSRERGDLPGPLKWFQGQLTRAQPFGTVNIPDFPNDPSDNTPQVVCSPEFEEYQGVDGNAEQLTDPVSLLDMRISQRLTSRGLHSHSSSPQLSSWGSQSQHRGHSRISRVSRQKSTNRFKHHQSASNSGTSEFTLPTRWGDVLRDSISFICASTDNCAESTSESFAFSGPSSLMADKEETSLPSIDSPSGLVLPVRRNSFADSIVVPSARLDRRCTRDSSAFASETLSFHEREVELDRIKTRFPKMMEKSREKLPVRSKFNEEFGERQTSMRTTRREKQSLSTLWQAPRLVKLVSRSYDGASPFELQAPGRNGFGYNFSNRSHSNAGTVSPGARSLGTMIPSSPAKDSSQIQGDDAEEIWAQALKRTQEEYHCQLISDSSPMKRDLIGRHGSFLAIRSVSRKLKGKGKASMDSLMDIETEILPIEGSDFELGRELRRQARKIETERSNADEWADELEARERQAKAKTAAVGRGPSPPRAGMPPESWARFPSHTREERTASAGPLDNVNPKDFAIKTMKDNVVEWMISDRKHHHHQEKEHHHSLPFRVSKQIRASLYKLRTATSTATSDVIHGRKGSISVGGKLEFPELEILPGEVPDEGLYEKVKRETEEAMRQDERSLRMVVFGEGGVDGKHAVEGNMTVVEVGESSGINIADPRFYDDCVTLPPEEDDGIDKIGSDLGTTIVAVEKADSPILDNAIIKKEEYQTPNDRERAAKVYVNDSTALRKSTLDFQMELELIEKLEMDRAIRSAEEAWGESVA